MKQAWYIQQRSISIKIIHVLNNYYEPRTVVGTLCGLLEELKKLRNLLKVTV